MSKKKYIFASIHEWNKKKIYEGKNNLPRTWYFINDPRKLNIVNIGKILVEYILYLHHKGLNYLAK